MFVADEKIFISLKPLGLLSEGVQRFSHAMVQVVCLMRLNWNREGARVMCGFETTDLVITVNMIKCSVSSFK